MAAKRLHRPMPATWWLKKRNYFVFMMRELSSVFVALVAVGTICLVIAVRDGGYSNFVEVLTSPAMLVFSFVALAFALLHTVTFFTAAGKVLVIPMGTQRVPASLVVAGHFGAWITLSLVFGWLVLRFAA